VELTTSRTVPALARPFEHVVITTTDLKEWPEPALLELGIEKSLHAGVETVEWDQFFAKLLDPGDISLMRQDLLCLIFVRYEDWDHFQDYVTKHNITPSYAMARKKISELIYAVDCAAVRSASRIVIVVLPCSEVVGKAAELVAFFSELTEHMRASLAHHAGTVDVIDWR
jgi:hypothetical protein